MTVFELNDFVRKYLESDSLLSSVTVCGEVSGFKAYPSGHWYFSLKDERASIDCSFFAQYNARCKEMPRNGMKINASGYVSVYVQNGRYQLYVRSVQEAGEGDALQQLEKLKQKLLEEGLFDETRKRPLPFMPKKIGVVTSSAGAAFHDILKVTAMRDPSVSVVLASASVQGDTAPREIAAAVKLLNTRNDIDVLIVGRGGGSAQDLWCFNDEAVVRAVAESKIPVISAVGHEIDYTLTDFAADRRAATPSQAAEIAVRDVHELKQRLISAKNRALLALQDTADRAQTRLNIAAGSYILKEPERLIAQHGQQLDILSDRINGLIFKRMDETKIHVDALESRAQALSPQAVLKRGYAAISYKDGGIVKSVGGLKAGDSITVSMFDGSIGATVTEKS